MIWYGKHTKDALPKSIRDTGKKIKYTNVIDMGYEGDPPRTFMQMIRYGWLTSKKKDNWDEVKRLEAKVEKLKRKDADIHKKLIKLEEDRLSNR